MLRESREPMCHRHWQLLWRRDSPRARAVQQLLDDGLVLPARVLAALVAELPSRYEGLESVEEHDTWRSVRAGWQERLGEEYSRHVAVFRELLDSIYVVLEHAASAVVPAGEPAWLPTELATAMIRTASGVDRYEGLLVCAAVELEEALFGETRDPLPRFATSKGRQMA